jgi:hypothetical protein
MSAVLPALPVSGPSGKRARRREVARLAQRQGAARRSGKTSCPREWESPCPRERESPCPRREWESWLRADACSLINQLQNYNKSSALITILRSNFKTTRLQAYQHDKPWMDAQDHTAKQGGADEGDASGTMSKVECATIQGEVRNDPM